jgi:hypothetical protein
MKNYQLLLARLASALKPSGKLFVHIFAHKDTPYHFEDGWMSRFFFSGGTMPSADLLLFFQEDVQVQSQWWISGKHYAKTCEVRANSLYPFMHNMLTSFSELASENDSESKGIMATSRQHVWRNKRVCLVLPLADILHGLRGAICLRRWRYLGYQSIAVSEVSILDNGKSLCSSQA